jgi:hypothetical protein
MREPEIWEESDLLELIKNKTEESIQLEYKRSDALQGTERERNEISKDVSAFANSIGGTILYGMQQSEDEPHYAAGLSPIDPEQISKEWLEQVLNSRIQPRIPGLLINPIQLKSAPSPGFAFVVVIPESATAHQASDKRYYKRFNFQSVPMEDYEVRQTMNRASRPAYKIELLMRGIPATPNNLPLYRFEISVENQSEMVGRDVSAVLFVPRHRVHPGGDRFTDFQGIEYTKIGAVFTPGSYAFLSAVPTAHPLTRYQMSFPGEIHLSPESPPTTLVVKVFDQFGLALIAYYVYDLSGLRLRKETQAAKRSPSAFAAGKLE